MLYSGVGIDPRKVTAIAASRNRFTACPRRSMPASSGPAVQDARERGGHLVRLDRLGEQFTDADGERLLRRDRAGIAAHQHDRQVGPMAAYRTRQLRPGESGHGFIGDDDVESLGRSREWSERGLAIGE